jgi:pimeloyl-ACP methyl ester carboxylesterase
MTIYRYFRENSTTHSSTNAFLLSLASLYIYQTEPPAHYGASFTARLRRVMRELSDDSDRLTVTTYLRAGSGISDFPYDTQAAVISNSRVIIVTFRGSEAPWSTIRDWMTNFDRAGLAVPTPPHWGPVHVHRGFFNALASQYNMVRNRVRALRTGTNPPKVFLTGHSLGGGLATLCAYAFRQLEDIPVQGVYTFGGVKVGTRQFRESYNDLSAGNGGTLRQCTFRWVRGNDFAARLPRAGAPIPTQATMYHHVGRLNFIRRDGTVQMNRGELNALPTGATGAEFDHRMPRYCAGMHTRLSGTLRSSPSSPAFLVRTDCAPLGL